MRLNQLTERVWVYPFEEYCNSKSETELAQRLQRLTVFAVNRIVYQGRTRE